MEVSFSSDNNGFSMPEPVMEQNHCNSYYRLNNIYEGLTQR
ncbi:MAG: hypothetical protein ACRCT7_04075 [Shewanella sp.]